MINLHERMLPTSAGVAPATSWSPVGRRIQLSHRGRLLDLISLAQIVHGECTDMFDKRAQTALYCSPDSSFNWPFVSREEVQYKFSRWIPCWISYQKDFSYFDTSNEVSSQLAFWFRIKKFKIDFQQAARATIVDFR